MAKLAAFQVPHPVEQGHSPFGDETFDAVGANGVSNSQFHEGNVAGGAPDEVEPRPDEDFVWAMAVLLTGTGL
jgi:hypothetical protein